MKHSHHLIGHLVTLLGGKHYFNMENMENQLTMALSWLLKYMQLNSVIQRLTFAHLRKNKQIISNYIIYIFTHFTVDGKAFINGVNNPL